MKPLVAAPRFFIVLALGAGSISAQSNTQKGVGAFPGTGQILDANELIIHGQVAFEDGSAPERLVIVERVCRGAVQSGGFADAKGRFSFDLGALNRSLGSSSVLETNSSGQLLKNGITAEDVKSCIIRATLPGYRSDEIPVGGKTLLPNSNVGTIILKPAGSHGASTRSSKDSEAPKNARKAYDRGMAAAAQRKWKEAMDGFRAATSAYDAYPSAWINLGMLEEVTGDLKGARESYIHAIKADGRFAPAYLQAAVVDTDLADWPAAVEHTGKLLTIDTDSFPRAYLLDALANVNLRNFDAAEKSATAGQTLDKEKRFPEFDYVLGMAEAGKNNRSSAIDHLQKYLSVAPNGPSAPTARELLLRLGVQNTPK